MEQTPAGSADPADLSGMESAAAKEYLLGFISALKLTEKQAADLDEELAKWESRAELANAQNRPDLAAEAEKEAEHIRSKRQQLAAETGELKAQIEKMRGQLPLLAARQRSIDPDLLEQELLMAAGRLPGDEEKAHNERMLREMEKDAAAAAALTELKAKLGNRL